MHLAARSSAKWREIACDAAAARDIGPRTCATALWRSASTFSGGARMSGLALLSGISLVDRVEALLHPVEAFQRRTVAATAALAVAAAAISTVVVVRAPAYALPGVHRPTAIGATGATIPTVVDSRVVIVRDQPALDAALSPLVHRRGFRKLGDRIDFQQMFAVVLRVDMHRTSPQLTMESIRATSGMVRITGGSRAAREYRSVDRWIFEGTVIPRRAAGETPQHGARRAKLNRAYGIWTVPQAAYHAGDEVEVVSSFGKSVATTRLP